MSIIGDLNWGLDQLTGAAAGAIVDAFAPTPATPQLQPSFNLPSSAYVPALPQIAPVTQYAPPLPSSSLLDSLMWKPDPVLASFPASAAPAQPAFNVLDGTTAWGGSAFTPTVSGGGLGGTIAKTGARLVRQYGPDVLKGLRQPFTPTGLASMAAWEAATYIGPKLWEALTEKPTMPPTNPRPPLAPIPPNVR